jgi:hypothetical protein
MQDVVSLEPRTALDLVAPLRFRKKNYHEETERQTNQTIFLGAVSQKVYISYLLSHIIHDYTLFQNAVLRLFRYRECSTYQLKLCIFEDSQPHAES